MKTHPFDSVPLSGQVFETLRVYSGRIFLLDRHMERLSESAQAAGLPKIHCGRAAGKVQNALRLNKRRDAMVRVTFSAAGLKILIVKRRKYPIACYERGVRLVTSCVRRSTAHSATSRIKSRDFLSGVIANAERPNGVFDVLHLSAQGHVAEAPTSNIFIVKQGRLITPPAWEGVLDGVTRRFVMELARGHGIESLEEPILRHDLYCSDECFLTNTSMEIMPVVCIDGRVMGAGRLSSGTRMQHRGRPGPVTIYLRHSFRKAITHL